MRIQMFPCPHCAAEFDSFRSLEHHIQASHGSRPQSSRHRCATCDAEFMREAKWLREA